MLLSALLIVRPGPETAGWGPRASSFSAVEWSALWQGLVNNLIHPKTRAFFFVVMPQFLVPGDTGGRLAAMVAAFESMLLVWLMPTVTW